MECKTGENASEIKSWFAFSIAGYNLAITIKEIEANDVVDLGEFTKQIPNLIEEYGRAKKIRLSKNQRFAINRSLFGMYSENQNNFSFHKGEQVLILQIADLVGKKMHGDHDYSYFRCESWKGQSVAQWTRRLGRYFASNKKTSQR